MSVCKEWWVNQHRNLVDIGPKHDQYCTLIIIMTCFSFHLNIRTWWIDDQCRSIPIDTDQRRIKFLALTPMPINKYQCRSIHFGLMALIGIDRHVQHVLKYVTIRILTVPSDFTSFCTGCPLIVTLDSPGNIDKNAFINLFDRESNYMPQYPRYNMATENSVMTQPSLN